MDVYMNDDRNVYRIIAFDSLKDAWKRYMSSVKASTIVLREHGFTEEEIQKLIEDSRT